MTKVDVKKWFEEFLRPTLLSDQDLGPPEQWLAGGLALLSADTDRTQTFVFESPRLTEIRGASMRLEGLHKKMQELLLEVFEEVSSSPLPANGKLTNFIIDPDEPGCIVFNDGGGMMALVPKECADEFVKAIERLFPQETDMATVTAVAHPITPDDVRGIPHTINASQLRQQVSQLAPAAQARILRSYGKEAVAELDDTAVAAIQGIPRLMRRQQMRLRQKKQAKQTAPLMEAHPFTRRCQSCGKRPSIGTVPPTTDGEKAQFFCKVCHDNHEAGKNGRSRWQEDFIKWYNDSRQPDQQIKATHNENLSDIGADSKKARYVGYIYTDGNNIGQLMEKSASLKEYAAVSQTLTKAMKTAVFQALAAHIIQDDRHLHFEIITIGGDDAILIVPAHVAIPVARAICQIFADEMAATARRFQLADPPGMSAGVVIAQEKNPIYFLNELARQLLKNAKKGSRQQDAARQQGTPVPCVDFMVLKSQSTIVNSIGDLRQSAVFRVKTEMPKERCDLTARPYTLDEIDRLWKNAQELNEVRFSPGQLHQMRQAFQKGRFPGIFHYLYQTARFSEQNRDLFHKIEAEWGLIEDEKGGAPPWRILPLSPDGFQEFDTPFLDMLELREFIPQNEGGNDASTD